MLDRTVFQLNEIVNEIKGDCYTVCKTVVRVVFLLIRHGIFFCYFLSQRPYSMDLRAYIYQAQTEIHRSAPEFMISRYRAVCHACAAFEYYTSARSA